MSICLNELLHCWGEGGGQAMWIIFKFNNIIIKSANVDKGGGRGKTLIHKMWIKKRVFFYPSLSIKGRNPFFPFPLLSQVSPEDHVHQLHLGLALHPEVDLGLCQTLQVQQAQLGTHLAGRSSGMYSWNNTVWILSLDIHITKVLYSDIFSCPEQL